MIVESHVWRPGARVKINPDEAAAELNRIRGSRGKITTDVVVKEAKPKSHLFHAHIWSATAEEAEMEYRRTRAAEIMRGLFVVIRPVDNEPSIEVPAFPNMKESEANDERQCLPIEEVYGNGELRKQLIAEFKVRLANLRKVYGGLVELAEVWEAGDRVMT